MERKPAVEIG